MLQTTHQTRHIIKLMNTLLIVFALCSCSVSSFLPAPQQESAYVSEYEEPAEAETSAEPEFTPIFLSESVPDEVRDRMWNVTISEHSHVSFDDLCYLTLTYTGYDDCPHIGHMVVDKQLGDEVVSIFRELYEAGFPIEKMNLPCEYGGVDELSMEDNNTSAFNDRPIEGSGSLSYHQLGRAIDINPLINPYIKYSTDTILPVTGGRYLDRTLGEKGMITADGDCVRIFKRYGWGWGGDWHSLKDYQHFEKK